MKRFILVVVFGVLFGFSVNSVSAQVNNCPVPMPVGTVCLSQEAANRAAENARIRPQLEEKNRVLEAALVEERKNTKQAQDVGVKNADDLKDVVKRTEIEFARTGGQLIECQGERTRLIGMTEVLVKNTRPKKIGLINLF